MMLATKLDTVLKAAKSSVSSAPPTAVSPTPTSDTVSVDGFDSSAIFSQMKAALAAASKSDKETLVKKGKGVFQFDVKVRLFVTILSVFV